MCGSQGQLFKTIIEGAELNVCHECSKFGKVIKIVKLEPEIKRKEKTKTPEEEVIEVFVEDFAEKIKKKREELGLTQKEFAKKINEKESVIHKLESGNFEPTLGLGKKLENILKIKLIEEHEEGYKIEKKQKGDTLTLGDLIKIKKG